MNYRSNQIHADNNGLRNQFSQGTYVKYNPNKPSSFVDHRFNQKTEKKPIQSEILSTQRVPMEI